MKYGVFRAALTALCIALPVAAQSQNQAAGGEVLEQFAVEVQQQVAFTLMQSPEYPSEALENGWEGTTQVTLHYAPNGRTPDVSIQRSSGHAVLDRAALDLVGRTPLPQTPEALRESRFTVTFPIAFRVVTPPSN